MLLGLFGASEGLAIEIVSMYRGSCQVDSGVVLRVDGQSVTFLSLNGKIERIPRYDIVGVASYPLPYLPMATAWGAQHFGIDWLQFDTYSDGEVKSLAVGWPINYNAEYIHLLRRDGSDQLVRRSEIWGVHFVPVKNRIAFRNRPEQRRFELRHPLAFEKCPANITPGQGAVSPIIPRLIQTDPITIKRYHDQLQGGYEQILEYEDRQRFYAVPHYYFNRTLLGTWALVGSRYANVGARQANFLPLVQDELSEGPFGYQRVVRSGVAPLTWSLQDEPIVQVFYGLKADYIHLELFFDPTAPLIGDQYNWSKRQLDTLDTRLIEKGGLEFGFDFGNFSVMVATTSGDLAVRSGSEFASGNFDLARVGLRAQYNFYRLTIYSGANEFDLGDTLRYDLRFAKIIGEAPLGDSHHITLQYLKRTLSDRSSAKLAQFQMDSVIDAATIEWDYDLNYRWTVRLLASVEHQKATSNIDPKSADEVYPKFASGVTIAF